MDIVLVIDDEKPILNMFQLLLGFYGYTVLTAENGEQGISIFKKESPPIVFLDIKMPGMDGREVLKQIREIDPDAEVIIMTGHGDKDLEREVMNLQANDYINKPFQKDSLEEALKRLAQRRGK
ncbi:MAG: response regulator [Desulfobacterales bacterium]|nr:response regulator [Desulfobacterales bacterium]